MITDPITINFAIVLAKLDLLNGYTINQLYTPISVLGAYHIYEYDNRVTMEIE